MTLIGRFRFRCDRCNKRRTFGWGVSHTEACKTAKNEGWVLMGELNDHEDLCPRCTVPEENQ